MIEFKEALSHISTLASQIQLEAEIIPLEHADGRICSVDIFSLEAVPAFNNSAMDGFAIHAEDTREASDTNPIRLHVSSVLAAGDEVQSYSAGIRAVEIMTGAPLPEIFDAVVKIEDVEVLRSADARLSEICVRTVIPKGNNIRKIGSDFKVGQVVLLQGSAIRAESMMALASLGISQVSVFQKPTVAILSTGKELVPSNTQELKPGMIRNSTALYFQTAFAHLGGNVVHVSSVGDEVEGFKKHLAQILDGNIDILVTTGAVSMGKYDFIPAVLKDMGAEIIFHKVAIRPGKPILLAKIPRQGGRPLVVFGMPGNPVSSAVGLRFFLTPLFRELNRQKPEQGLRVKLSEAISKPPGLKCFFKARLENSENEFCVSALSGQASFMVSSLVRANSWVLFSEVGSTVGKNEEVLVYPLLPDQAFNLEGL